MKRKWGRLRMGAQAAYCDGSRRVAEYLRNSYADARAKRVARELGVSVAQAERYIAGKSLPSWVLFAMAKTHGWAFVREVFELLCGPSDDDKLIAQEQAQREANREFIREALREAVSEVIGQGAPASMPAPELGYGPAGSVGREAVGVRPEVAKRRAGGRHG